MTDYQAALEFSLGVPFTNGNHIEILQNGDEIFPAMLGAIKDAKESIELVTFVYWQGNIAEEFAESLADKASSGVKVRVLLDAVGSREIEGPLCQRMQEAGVCIRWFRPLSSWRFWRHDKRTHRKLLICDNIVGFTGGVGIADEWTGAARNPDEWRDIHLSIQGPALFGLHAAFSDNWNEAGEWELELPPNTKIEDTGDIPVQVIRGSSTTGWTEIARMTRVMASLAKKRICIITGYFAPDPTLVALLCTMSKKNVVIDIMVPGQQTDSRLSQFAGQLSYQALLNSGVNLYRYQKTLLHSKVMVIDNRLSSVGSANMNHRSLSKDEECNVIINSEKISTALTRTFDDDIQFCEKLDSSSWSRRPASTRVLEYASRLLVEQL